jgi:hypothetical protein
LHRFFLLTQMQSQLEIFRQTHEDIERLEHASVHELLKKAKTVGDTHSAQRSLYPRKKNSEIHRTNWTKSEGINSTVCR